MTRPPTGSCSATTPRSTNTSATSWSRPSRRAAPAPPPARIRTRTRSTKRTTSSPTRTWTTGTRSHEVEDDAQEDLGHDADGDAGAREQPDGLLDRPRVRGHVLLLGVRVEDVAVGLEREPEPREVGAEQHDRDREGHVLDGRREVGRLVAQLR